MLPIHLAIGTVEGLATAAVVIFISKAQPSLLRPADLETGTVKKASWTVLGIFAVAALLCGAALSWFASAYPDGLEWSVAGVTGSEETRLPDFQSGAYTTSAIFPYSPFIPIRHIEGRNNAATPTIVAEIRLERMTFGL